MTMFHGNQEQLKNALREVGIRGGATARAVCQAAIDEIDRQQEFIDAAFVAHSNLNLDVDRINAPKETNQ